MYHPNQGQQMQVVGFTGGGGGGGRGVNKYSVQPLKFLLVKMKIGPGFPFAAGKVEVKLVGGRPGESSQVGELEMKNRDGSVTVYFSQEAVVGATEVEVSLADKESSSSSARKRRFEIPEDLGLIDPALDLLSLTDEGEEELYVNVWWGGQNDPAYRKVVKAGSKMYTLKNLVYYPLFLSQLTDLNTALLPPNSVCRITATIGTYTSTTDPFVGPRGGPILLKHQFWSVKLLINDNHAPANNHLDLTLWAASSDGNGNACGEYRNVAAAVQNLEELHKKKAADVRLKKPPASDEGENAAAVVGVVKVQVGAEAPHCHVFTDEPDKSSDLEPPENGRPEIGYLEVRVDYASNVVPMKLTKSRGATADTYCLVKFGRNLYKTRTAIGELNPRFDEQCSWPVFDTHTVFSVALFHNCQIPEPGVSGGEGGGGGGGQKKVEDKYMGRVVVRISTLFPGKLYYRSTFPLYLLQPNPPPNHPPMKPMAELTLSFRFTLYPSAFPHFLPMLFRSPLPAPDILTPPEAEMLKLRPNAVAILEDALAVVVPPLGKAVLEDVHDDYKPCFSLRRMKTHRQRLLAAAEETIYVRDSLGKAVVVDKSVAKSGLLLFLIILLICCSAHIPHVILISSFVIGLYNLCFRLPEQPPGINPILIRVANNEIPLDSLDEEADTTPSSRPPEVIKKRHDELSKLVGIADKRAGDVAAMVVKFRAVLSWWDPRATGIFVFFCAAAAAALFLIGPLVCCGVAALVFVPFYLLETKGKMPSPLSCFVSRLLTAPSSRIE